MKSSFKSMCDQMHNEQKTVRQNIEKERKRILERAMPKESPDQIPYKTAQVAWYDHELKCTEKARRELHLALEELKSSKKGSSAPDGYQRLEEENESLKATLQSRESGVESLTQSLETETSKVEDLTKKNETLSEIFRMAPASKEATMAFFYSDA